MADVILIAVENATRRKVCSINGRHDYWIWLTREKRCYVCVCAISAKCSCVFIIVIIIARAL